MDSRDRSALSWAALKGDYEAVSLLIAAGADINLADCEGNTPLIYSLQSKNTTCMASLLEAGANALAKSYMGRDALWSAVEHLAPVHCLRALINAGIDIATKDLRGTGLLVRAIVHNNYSWAFSLILKPRIMMVTRP